MPTPRRSKESVSHLLHTHVIYYVDCFGLKSVGLTRKLKKNCPSLFNSNNFTAINSRNRRGGKKVLISMYSHENFSLVSNLEHSYRYRFTIFHICCALALKTREQRQKNNNKLCADESRKQNTNKNQEMKKVFFLLDERFFFIHSTFAIVEFHIRQQVIF